MPSSTLSPRHAPMPSGPSGVRFSPAVVKHDADGQQRADNAGTKLPGRPTARATPAPRRQPESSHPRTRAARSDTRPEGSGARAARGGRARRRRHRSAPRLPHKAGRRPPPATPASAVGRGHVPSALPKAGDLHEEEAHRHVGHGGEEIRQPQQLEIIKQRTARGVLRSWFDLRGKYRCWFLSWKADRS